MNIKEANVILGPNCEGACYVSDRFGNLIGWYDYDSKVLKVDSRYKYTEKLVEHHIEANFQIIIEDTKEPEVLKYYAKRKKLIEQWRKDEAEKEKRINEYFKLMPSKKKVKNAEQKIKKRHDG